MVVLVSVTHIMGCLSCMRFDPKFWVVLIHWFLQCNWHYFYSRLRKSHCLGSALYRISQTCSTRFGVWFSAQQKWQCYSNKDLLSQRPCKLYSHMLQILSSQPFWAVLLATWQGNVVIVYYMWGKHGHSCTGATHMTRTLLTLYQPYLTVPVHVKVP